MAFLKHLGDIECYVEGENFVIGRCDQCFRCGCEELAHFSLLGSRHQPHCYNYASHFDHGKSIIIAAKGINRNMIGTPAPVTAVGIFCNINSEYNKSILFGEHLPSTEPRAQLGAAFAALSFVRDFFPRGHFPPKSKEVVIKTDSPSVVLCMASYINILRRTQFIGDGGFLVANHDLINAVDKLVTEIAGLGLRVRFWLCLPESNVPAERLAEAAFCQRSGADLTMNELFCGATPKHYIIDEVVHC